MIARARRLWAFYSSRQFIRFVAVGGVALAIHWLSRLLLNEFVSYGIAIVAAYAVGIAVAFVLNRIYVFPHSRRSLRFEASAFAAVNLAAFPFVWLIAYALGEWVLRDLMEPRMAYAVAHAIAITLPVFANFALHKLITFRGS